MDTAQRSHDPQSTVPPGMAAPAPDRTSERLGGESSVPTAGVLAELSNALASAGAAVSSFLELVSLEAHRASVTLLWMLVGGVVAGICIVTAWLGLMVAFAVAAVSLGTPPAIAAFAIAVVNLLAGAFLVRACVGMSRNLLFAATRRQIAGAFPAGAAAP